MSSMSQLGIYPIHDKEGINGFHENLKNYHTNNGCCEHYKKWAHNREVACPNVIHDDDGTNYRRYGTTKYQGSNPHKMTYDSKCWKWSILSECYMANNFGWLYERSS